MTAGVELRALDVADAQAFHELRLKGLRECPSAFASSEDEEATLSSHEIAQWIAPKPDAAVLGAWRADRLVGIVGLQREGLRKLSHKAVLWGLYVETAARRSGVGEQLMGHAMAYAKAVLGVRQIVLGVNTRNAAALALYERLGFERFGLERGFMILDGELHDEVHMVRVLE